MRINTWLRAGGGVANSEEHLGLHLQLNRMCISGKYKACYTQNKIIIISTYNFNSK